MKHLLRTRFARDIVAEVAAPSRSSSRVVIVLGGMPGVPRKDELLHWLAARGYWAIFPRYRGSWESGGHFLSQSPERDVLDVIDGLKKPVVDSWSNTSFRIPKQSIFLLGASFGGPAAILASRDPRVRAAVALAPVIDWRVKSPDEPLDQLERFVRQGFGAAYRFRPQDWKKLSGGRFYSPAAACDTVDGQKLYLVHAKDDTIVPWQPTAAFAEMTNAPLTLVGHGGHLSLSDAMTPRFSKRVLAFFRSR